MDLSIIILNYKTRDLTLACLQSVFSSATAYIYEVILIDNASNDGIISIVNEQYPQVVTIDNTDNVGFSIANNQGIRIAQGRYVLLLNSDTIVQPDTLDVMLRFMDESPNVGASGCKSYFQTVHLIKPARGASQRLQRPFIMHLVFLSYSLRHLASTNTS